MTDLAKNLIITSAKSLFVFYLIVSGNYLGSLFGCQIKDIFTNNMYVKHFLGLLTLYFFVSLVDTDNKYNSVYKLLITFGIYIFFVLSTKVHYKPWIIFITLLGLVYIISIFKDIYPDDETFKNIMRNIQLGLITLAIVILLVGMIYYMGEKKLEYGKDFEYNKFFIGTPDCTGKTYPIDQSISEVFITAITPVEDVQSIGTVKTP